VLNRAHAPTLQEIAVRSSSLPSHHPSHPWLGERARPASRPVGPAGARHPARHGAGHRQRAERGQGMTEYIIVVALVAVAAIGVYNLFGTTLRNQMAGVTLGLAGKGDDAVKASKRAGENAKAADNAASTKSSLENFGKDAGRSD
jgi:Flp pilus assembly pilin Flp